MYEDLIIPSHKVVVPLLNSLNDAQELPILHGVVMFGRCAFSRAEVDPCEQLETLIQVENAGNREVADFDRQSERLCRVEVVQNWCIGEHPCQLRERKFCIPSPVQFELFTGPRCICFLQQVRYRCCYLCMFPHKLTVEVCEFEQHYHMLNRLRGSPILEL